MDAEDPTTPRRAGRKRLIAVIGTAALAIPGGMAVSNALAADGTTGTTGTTGTSDATTLPIQESERPDGRDCPEKDGDSGASGESAAPSTSDGAQQTAL